MIIRIIPVEIDQFVICNLAINTNYSYTYYLTLGLGRQHAKIPKELYNLVHLNTIIFKNVNNINNRIINLRSLKNIEITAPYYTKLHNNLMFLPELEFCYIECKNMYITINKSDTDFTKLLKLAIEKSNK